LKEAGFRWTGLTDAQRWHYHAYDYAFLRVRHGLDNHSYPLDPDGKWFHEGLAQEAELIYRPHKSPGTGARPLPRVKYQPCPAPEERMSQSQINAAMGVAATERRKPKHQDPEELRRGRVELGLEGETGEDVS
jgi:hypothetical protein